MPSYVGCYPDGNTRTLVSFIPNYGINGYPGYNLLQYCHAYAIANGGYYFGLESDNNCFYVSINLGDYLRKIGPCYLKFDTQWSYFTGYNM